ncbi:AAEL008440-PA [Aedes aegypti]|uniref:AAEL008440-PA n=1 Tax=Aedes aegypti TaxID=7159 RepID=Q16QG3_AEDAE|nr:AAEL011299-PA [Aedes aegypti]EAT39772.1 AAEL008440-PA [Aedes aegypti]
MTKSVLETLGHRVIKENQARALLQCINYLTDNISFFGLFLSAGSLEHLERIYNKIESGHAEMYNYLLQQSAPRECAMAVHRFIRAHKISILPERALNLLCAQNYGIPQRLVALDALNLLLHESSGMRWQFARAYLLMMQQLTLRGYLTPHEIRIVISPYLAVPAIFPGRSSLQNVTSKSATLLEMFLNAHLLDDPQSLSAELSKETIKFKLRLRRMIPP